MLNICKIPKYESNGRRLMVEFTCRRCKRTATRTLSECMDEATECYRDLYDLRPPKGWEDGGFYYPLFCGECAEKYKQFMSGKGVSE